MIMQRCEALQYTIPVGHGLELKTPDLLNSIKLEDFTITVVGFAPALGSNRWPASTNTPSRSALTIQIPLIKRRYTGIHTVTAPRVMNLVNFGLIWSSVISRSTRLARHALEWLERLKRKRPEAVEPRSKVLCIKTLCAGLMCHLIQAVV